MNTKDLFKIFDACGPTVAQVQEYLDRISGNSPFLLVFLEDGKEIFTKKITCDNPELVGIVIEDTVFYTKAMTKDDFDSAKRLSVNDVFAFGQKIDAKAQPMNEASLALLKKYFSDCEKLQDMLQAFGYSLSLLQDWYLLFDKPCDNTYADDFNLYGYCDRNTDISHFLTFCGNIFFCAGRQVNI